MTSPLISALRRQAERRDYVGDPVAWVRDRLGEHLWSKQRQIVQSVVDNRLTAVKSCHDVGKSFVASRATCWWLEVHPPGEAFVVSTAPTEPQVKAVLWREIGKAHRKGKLIGRVNQKEWLIGAELIAFGRKPADYDPTAFQGIHARYVLVIIDEACGIPKELWVAALSLAANDDCRVLAIGNPDDPGAYFAQVCAPDSGWNVIQIGAFDSPNFTDEDVPAEVKRDLIGPIYVAEMANPAIAGKGSPAWISKVLGEFPDDAEDGVVRLSKVKHCQRPEQVYERLLPVELGVDVGAGGDASVIVLRTGPVARVIHVSHQPDTMKFTGEIVRAILEHLPSSVKVDKTGVGQGVVDRLAELAGEGRIETNVVGVMVGEKSREPERFVNLRSEIWWQIGRQLSEEGGWDLSGISDATVHQLTAPKYALDSAGRIKVEKKEEVRKRIGRSPDEADALLLAFYEGGSSARSFLDAITRLCPKCTLPNDVESIRCRWCGETLIGAA